MAHGRYIKLQAEELPALTPGQTLTPQEARERGYLLDTEFYPWKALTGRRLPRTNCFSRHSDPEFYPVYTDTEASLRGTLTHLQFLLTSRKGEIDIDEVQKIITESLEKTAVQTQ
jgi:hypothetical protein